MTVSGLRRILQQCKPDAAVFIRLDDEALDNLRGPVCEILGHEYGYGCTESLALMLECGQPEATPPANTDQAKPVRHTNPFSGMEQL